MTARSRPALAFGRWSLDFPGLSAGIPAQQRLDEEVSFSGR
jgi:hypothetical protein